MSGRSRASSTSRTGVAFDARRKKSRCAHYPGSRVASRVADARRPHRRRARRRSTSYPELGGRVFLAVLRPSSQVGRRRWPSEPFLLILADLPTESGPSSTPCLSAERRFRPRSQAPRPSAQAASALATPARRRRAGADQISGRIEQIQHTVAKAAFHSPNASSSQGTAAGSVRLSPAPALQAPAPPPACPRVLPTAALTPPSRRGRSPPVWPLIAPAAPPGRARHRPRSTRERSDPRAG